MATIKKNAFVLHACCVLRINKRNKNFQFAILNLKKNSIYVYHIETGFGLDWRARDINYGSNDYSHRLCLFLQYKLGNRLFQDDFVILRWNFDISRKPFHHMVKFVCSIYTWNQFEFLCLFKRVFREH